MEDGGEESPDIALSVENTLERLFRVGKAIAALLIATVTALAIRWFVHP